LSDIGAVGGVDVQATALTGFTGDEVDAVVILQLAVRVDGEAWGRGCTLVTLELGSWGYSIVKLNVRIWSPIV
jgi:hypothetical protein